MVGSFVQFWIVFWGAIFFDAMPSEVRFFECPFVVECCGDYLHQKNEEYWSEVVALFNPAGAQKICFFSSDFHVVRNVGV